MNATLGVAQAPGLVKRLEVEWQQLVTTRGAARSLEAWALREPALAQWATLAQLRTATEDRTRPERSDAILAALTRLAAHDGGDDSLAARVLVQLLLPGAVRLARRLRGCYGGDPVEAEAAVLAELAVRIKTYPWRRRPARVAANLLLDTQHSLLAEARRHRDLVLAADPIEDTPVLENPLAERYEVIELFAWATREGVLSPDEAGIIAAHRVDETSIAELAAATGRSQPTLFRIRAKAERRLRVALSALAEAA